MDDPNIRILELENGIYNVLATLSMPWTFAGKLENIAIIIDKLLPLTAIERKQALRGGEVK